MILKKFLSKQEIIGITYRKVKVQNILTLDYEGTLFRFLYNSFTAGRPFFLLLPLPSGLR